MSKRADVELPLYTTMSIIMGIFLFVFFINLGYRFGDDEERHQEYIIKDTALLMNALHVIPGNVVVDMHYLVYDKELRQNSTFFSIIDPGTESMEGFYRFRYAGMRGKAESIVEKPEFFEVSSYSGSVGINQEGDLDMLRCKADVRHEFDPEDIQFLHVADDVNFARDLIENIAWQTWDDQSTRQARTGQFSSDNFLRGIPLSMAFSAGDVSERYYAYVHHGNSLAHEIACKIINGIVLTSSVDADDFRVYAIDPSFHKIKGEKIPENMIFFELGSKRGGIDDKMQLISNRVVEVMRSYG